MIGIKRGKPNPGRKFRGTCYWCKCEVEITESEIVSFTHEPDTTPFVHVKCPEDGCRYTIHIQVIIK